MPAPTLTIFFHNHCFDGATSAALFAHYYRSCVDKDAVISYQGMAHSLEDPFANVVFSSDDNACVDFRYCAHPKMRWWFDHHQSGFQPASLQEHFQATQGTGSSVTKFFDPNASSCALFMSKVFLEQFELSLDGDWPELIEAADQIDSANFQSAAEVVRLATPALKIMTWLRGHQDPQQGIRLIEELGKRNLEEISNLPWLQETLNQLMAKHDNAIEIVGDALQFADGIASYDLTESPIGSHSGFIVYMLCPEATYSIGLHKNGNTAGISIGHNPWAKKQGSHNIAKICEDYGGGGHPKVGGITMPAGDMSRPRAIVEEIRSLLTTRETG